jgi:hypothetical protein
MAFEPDILVTSSDSSEIALVVEVKVSPQNLEASERQLKSYMAAVDSPVGLLITPECIRVYRNQYSTLFDDSIIKVGEFEAKNTFRFMPDGNTPENELAFSRGVQLWLEEILRSNLSQLSPDFKRAMQMYVIPALEQGLVRSGHPLPEVTA